MFITIEGVEGAGKSSVIADAAEFLREVGREMLITREPGGCALGKALRAQLLDSRNTGIAPETEIFLYLADRAQHVREVILPALVLGKVVLCDRFTDSTYAYQGAGAGYPAAQIDRLAAQVQAGDRPNLTLIFDVPPEVSRQRLAGTGKDPDKFEAQGLEYFAAVRNCYLEIAQREPDRVRVIDSTRPLAEVAAQVEAVVGQFLEQWGPAPAQGRRRHP